MQYATGNIVQFLQNVPTDAELVAILAHAEDNKLAYGCCTCLISSPGAPHVLVGDAWYCEGAEEHLKQARIQPFAEAAEKEFLWLGDPGGGLPYNNEMRRERVIPLLRAEIQRREQSRAQSVTGILDTDLSAPIA